MDADYFDQIARTAARARSRRHALRLVAGALAGPAVLLAPRPAAARLRNRAECRRGHQCCSGICLGRKGKKRCRPAPTQGVCAIAHDFCQELRFDCHAPGSTAGCQCFVTRSGASHCGRDFAICGACTADADCDGLTGEMGLTCVRCSACGGTACVRPCPNPA